MTYTLQKRVNKLKRTLDNNVVRLSMDTSLNLDTITSDNRVNNKNNRDIRMLANSVRLNNLVIRQVNNVRFNRILYTSIRNDHTKTIRDNSRRDSVLIVKRIKNINRNGSTNRLSTRVIPITSLITSLSFSNITNTKTTTTRRNDDTRDYYKNANALRRNTTKGFVKRKYIPP